MQNLLWIRKRKELQKEESAFKKNIAIKEALEKEKLIKTKNGIRKEIRIKRVEEVILNKELVLESYSIDEMRIMI